MNDNQNYFVTRSTSRVLSEPGGKSSVGFLFGGGMSTKAPESNKGLTEPEKVVRQQTVAAEKDEETKDPLKGDELKNAAATASRSIDTFSEAARIKQKNELQHFSIFGATTPMNDTQAESSNAFASAATTNSYNVLTGRPTSRVLMPPGGHSSIKLGWRKETDVFSHSFFLGNFFCLVVTDFIGQQTMELFVLHFNHWNKSAGVSSEKARGA